MAVTLASVDGTWANPTTYDAGELRRADAAMFSSAGVASGLAVSVDGSDVVTVTAGSAVISGEDAVAGTGVYRAGIPASVTGSLEARDATNGRIDLVVFRQYDTSVVGSHPRYASEIEIIKGTPSATPAVPTRPSMAVELARITVPASGGGAASVNSTNRIYAAASGGFRHTASGNRLDAAVAAPDHPAGLRMIAGQQTITFSAGAGTLTFPGGGFANGVLSLVVTTLSGSAVAAVVASGSVSKTQAAVVINGFTGSGVLSYMALGW